MRDLIENGFLYIAQSPLYKARIGSAEVYLKDEKELTNFLIQRVGQVARLAVKDGPVIVGQDLCALIAKVVEVDSCISKVEVSVARSVIEALVLSRISAAVLNDRALLESKMPEFKRILLGLRDDNDTRISGDVKWSARIELAGKSAANIESGEVDSMPGNVIVVERSIRGVKQSHVVDASLVMMPDIARAIKIEEVSLLSDVVVSSASLRVDSDEVPINSIKDFAKAVDHFGKRGLFLQRFKGLGEMNSEQLWETTLDADARTILKVNIADAEEANALFVKLMGEEVEPRRDFIVENALKVRDVDV